MRTNPFRLQMEPRELAWLEPIIGDRRAVTDLIEDFDYAPRDKPLQGEGAIVVGARRSGKTALLSLVAEAARWTQVVVVVTLREGEPLEAALREGLATAGPRMTTWLEEDADEDEGNAEDAEDWLGAFVAANDTLSGFELFAAVAAEAKERRRGTVLCVDDMHHAAAAELDDLAVQLRAFIRDERLPIFFRGFGLPRLRHNISLKLWRTLLRRRGTGQHLSNGYAQDIEWNFNRRILGHGGKCDRDAALLVVRSMAGSPYLMSLIGHHAWELSGAPDEPIGVDDVERAVELALPIYEREVSEPTWAERDAVERAVILAIFEHETRIRSHDFYSIRSLTEHLSGEGDAGDEGGEGDEGGDFDEQDVTDAINRLLVEDVIYEFPSPDGSLGLWHDNGLPPSFLDKQLDAAL